jgi:hypothetical protein
MSEPHAVEYWSSMTPIRLLFLFPLTAYTYIFKADGLGMVKGRFYKPNAGDNLKNGMIFTWSFLELVMWFWVRYNSQVGEFINGNMSLLAVGLCRSSGSETKSCDESIGATKGRGGHAVIYPMYSYSKPTSSKSIFLFQHYCT